jgi:DNA invertase Pin-like site-specific DNA recombinase
MRMAIYARVSTEDKGQDPENQLRDLRAWCAASGHEIVGEYIDRVSGRKGTGERKQFAALFEDASRRKFDCVLFWALDRFSREGMVPTIQHLERLSSYGVTFHSYTEPHLCADNEMVRGILLAVLATMAKQEAKRLSERVIAGMRKAAAKGTKSGNAIGRPRVSREVEKRIQGLLKGGTGINKTAKTVGVGTATVQRVRAEMIPFDASAVPA